MKYIYKIQRNESGFTLVELMISIAVSIIIAAAVYSSYKMQQKTFTAQDMVTEMQQNIRSGMFFLSYNIRMAGYNPEYQETNGRPDFTFLTATAGRIAFTLDDNGDPNVDLTDGNGTVDAGETIAFGFAPAADANNDGRPDGGGVASLGKSTDGGAYQPIAEDIERIQFLYTLDDGTQVLDATARLDDIRAVRVSILARARLIDPNYNDIRTYTLGDGTVVGPFNDTFRRRILTSTINCRNMGLIYNEG